MTMAYTMDKAGLDDLNATFSDIDVNNEGAISVQELRDAIRDKRTNIEVRSCEERSDELQIRQLRS